MKKKVDGRSHLRVTTFAGNLARRAIRRARELGASEEKMLAAIKAHAALAAGAATGDEQAVTVEQAATAAAE